MPDKIVTTTGKSHLLKLGFGAETSKFTVMRLGTGTSAPQASDTGLAQEVTASSYTPQTVTATFSSSTPTVTLEATFNENNITTTTQITELGIFTAESTPKMFCRCKIPSVTKDGNVSVTFRVSITIS
ncbi:MAG TPA: hypothetical protein PKU94_06240 [Candidatus Hydrothermia bacterium]|nr:hypothetical protein [Candidatus Hydrothermia bacterium]